MSCLSSWCQTKHESKTLPLYRTYTGYGNNPSNPSWGAVGAQLIRISGVDYADGKDQMVGQSEPRDISNTLCFQSESEEDPKLTNLMFGWGQFLDHELDLTSEGTESASMKSGTSTCPPKNKCEGCEEFPDRVIPFRRSKFHHDADGVRQQSNEISAFIDATNVYGYDEERANYLRMKDGSGELKTTVLDGEHYLIYNLDDMPNASLPGQDPKAMYLAGDVRANENSLLTCFHTLFMREHNKRCGELVKQFPTMKGNDEWLFQHARSWVIGLMQQITYNEYLPLLLEKTPAWTKYDEKINPGIAQEFSAAAYRFGHSMVSDTLKLVYSHGELEIPLMDAFFKPAMIPKHGIDAFLHGGREMSMQKIDLHIVPALRSFLFGPPTAEHLLDLASLNMQRGRDHGLPKYNKVREAYGLSKASKWCDVTRCTETQCRLATLYSSPDMMDLWVGCLAEDKRGKIGTLLHAILYDQFARLQTGDRYWFTRDPVLSEKEKRQLQSMTLADVIVRNTHIKKYQIGNEVMVKRKFNSWGWIPKWCEVCC